VLAVAVLVCGAVLFFWWSTPVTRETGGQGSTLVQVGRSTGMVAAILILVEVALMARVPVLERRIGTDRLSVVHAWLGGYVFWLVLTHTVAITVGDAMVVRTSPLHEAKVLVLTYPDVLAGTVGLGLLAMVVMTSMRPIRRRLRYETWHFVHLYAYLAIGLAFAHQFAVGAVFMHNRPARLVWVAVHLTVAFLVVRYRMLAPLWLYARHRFRVTEVVPEPDGSTSVYVSGRGMERLSFRAGQYFRWRFLARGVWWQAHPFSISHAPNGRWLRMTAKPLGDHSAWLTGCLPDTPVILEGPYGAMTDLLRRHRELVLVAGGSGVAPLLALAQQAVAAGVEAVTLIYRVSSAGHVNFRTELRQLEQSGRFRLVTVVGHRGLTDEDDPLNPTTLRELVNDPRSCDVYLCGPNGLTERVLRGLRHVGVPANRIHTEGFAFV
jgi:predicted ferric reductase